MKDTEAVALYHQAISVTPGDPTEFGADMWCELLREHRYQDARLAMVNLLRRSTFVSPAEIITEVRRLRAERWRTHGSPIPPADLTPIETKRWLQDAWRRIGDGETVEGSGVHHDTDTRQLGGVA